VSDRLAPDPLPRRDFLGLAGLWTAGIAIVGSVLGMMRLPKPRVLPETARKFRIGRPEEYPVGSAQVVPGQQVLVLSEAGGIAAISMICTHLGCVVSKTPTGFICPCHGSAFGPEGRVLAGPAPSALRWLEVSQTVDGRLAVNADREVDPGTFFQA